ncbi:MAG: hypothetical protein M3Q65_15415 [Chloroflexota bacterium]|nr:hypothetical protein [Chloroflexota bacterium]
MADWVVRRGGERVLEPSFGDGIFLGAVAASASRRDLSVRLSGVEIDGAARGRALATGLIADADARLADFLAVEPFPVQAGIGNPPYVRLRHLPAEQRDRALEAARLALGGEMDPSGSVWMPFVLHALRFLDAGGRLALVLPYEFTYVRYARPLWKVLGENFGSLRVLRAHERVFPDLMQEVVILLADDHGSRTRGVRYQAFERVADLLAGYPVVDETIAIEDLLRGERAFIGALLGEELRHLLRTKIAGATVAAREVAAFNIGYVTGDKTFFHPTAAEVRAYQLPAGSLRPAVTATRALRGGGLRTSALGADQRSNLFLPDPQALRAGERRYIRWGEARGVSRRYKCRVRTPWYVTPDTRVPDVILSVFSERPLLLINDAGYLASNSLLCGYLRAGATREALAASWYTSLTLLQCELEVHALGGGVLVLVPREAGNVRLPARIHAPADHLGRIDGLLRGGRVAEAYRAGDRPVLTEQLGLGEDEVALIRHGAAVLSHWRTSARSSLG